MLCLSVFKTILNAHSFYSFMQKMTKKDLKGWLPDYQALSDAHLLSIIEDDSRNNLSFSSMVYCILSNGEKFSPHKELYYALLYAGLLPPTPGDEISPILENKEYLRTIIEPAGRGKLKADSILSAAEQWDELDLVNRIRNDEKKEQWFDLRKELDEKIIGVGYKIASLYLQMSGYDDVGVIDRWAKAWLDANGFEHQAPLISGKTQGVKVGAYLKYEQSLTTVANDFGITPVMFRNAIYVEFSTWRKDSGLASFYHEPTILLVGPHADE
jgi:thermostable 8-oxoguanine DNA glycosylase